MGLGSPCSGGGRGWGPGRADVLTPGMGLGSATLKIRFEATRRRAQVPTSLTPPSASGMLRSRPEWPSSLRGSPTGCGDFAADCGTEMRDTPPDLFQVCVWPAAVLLENGTEEVKS